MPTYLKEGNYYTLTELAQKLGYLSTTDFADSCRKGSILAVKIGKTWLVHETEANRLANQEQKAQGNRGVARK